MERGKIIRTDRIRLLDGQHMFYILRDIGN